MKNILLILLFIPLFLQSQDVWIVREYDHYVSTTGSDSNDGLHPWTAWLTLSKAETTATDGESVCVLPGRYNMGTLTFDQNVTWYGYGATLYNNAADAAFIGFSGADVKTFYGFKFMKGATAGTCLLSMLNSSNNNFIDCDFRSVGARTGYWNSAGVAVKFGTFRGCNISSGSSGGIQSKQWFDMDLCTIDSIRAGSFAHHLDGNSGDYNINNCIFNVTGAGYAFYAEEDGDMNVTNSTININGAGGVLNAGAGASGNQDLHFDNNTINSNATGASRAGAGCSLGRSERANPSPGDGQRRRDCGGLV